MVRIKMKVTKNGSPDGKTVQPYFAGQEYEVPADLAREFLLGDAEKVVPAEEQAGNNKAVTNAPENKAAAAPGAGGRK